MRQSRQFSASHVDTCWCSRCSLEVMLAQSGTGHEGVRQWKEWTSDALKSSFDMFSPQSDGRGGSGGGGFGVLEPDGSTLLLYAVTARRTASLVTEEQGPSSASVVALLLAAVLCDAVSPVLQERLLRYRDVEPLQLMQRTNTLAFLGTAAAWAATGESTAVAAAATRLESPTRFVLLLSLYGATSFTGVVCMLALIERWGSAAGVAAGTLRKVLTVVLSFVAFPKGPPSPTFAISALAVLAAVVLHARAPKQGGGGGGGDGGRAAEEEERRKKKRRKPKPMKGVNGARLKF